MKEFFYCLAENPRYQAFIKAFPDVTEQEYFTMESDCSDAYTEATGKKKGNNPKSYTVFAAGFFQGCAAAHKKVG